MSVTISIKNALKKYGDNVIIPNLNLEIKEGEFFTLLGPSGCGKTTLLRMIAGFNSIEGGDFFFNDTRINDLDPAKRNIGMVFQNYAIFPHMTVRKNVEFGLKNKKLPKDQVKTQAEKFMALMHVDEYAERLPERLSGGQQQRVALARALCIEPDVLLFDEPLSNLDAKLRLEMRYELQRLHVETGSTFVYVTHDQMEAMTLATQICLINNGVLQQYDAPLTVYGSPNNLFVADFVGNPSINFVEAKGAQSADGSLTLTVFDDKKVKFVPNSAIDMTQWFKTRDDNEAAAAAKLAEAAKEKGYVEKGNKDETFRYHIAKVVEDDFSIQDDPVITNEDFVLGVRPEFISIANDGVFGGEIYGAMPTGMESTIKVSVDDFLLTGVVFGSTVFTIGEKVNINLSGDNIMLFDRKSGKLIAQGSIKAAE